MKIKVAELIEDFSLYPRSQVDGAHVQTLTEALLAGEKFPPIIIDEQNRIIDGFHRRRATLKALGNSAEIECDIRKYATDKDRFLDALRYNARHGKSITGAEQTGAIIKALKFEIEPQVIASSMGIRHERVNSIIRTKTGTIKRSTTAFGKSTIGDLIPIKRSVGHLGGKEITKAQEDAMDSLPGQEQSLLIEQLIRIIQIEAVDFSNKRVIIGLKSLRVLLNTLILEEVSEV